MAQLSTIIATEDAGLSVELKKLVRSAGVSVGIIEERSPDDSAVEPDLALIDIRAGASALDKVQEFRGRWPAVSIVAIAATAESQLILQAMRAGANEFFECPPDRSEFPATMQDGVGNAIRQAAERLAALDTKHVCRTLSFFGTKGAPARQRLRSTVPPSSPGRSSDQLSSSTSILSLVRSGCS